MDDLTDYTSEVVEFLPSQPSAKQHKLIDSSTATDPLPPNKDIAVETNRKSSMETQTETLTTSKTQLDEQKLVQSLRELVLTMEAELLKGPTPGINDGFFTETNSTEELEIEIYQKITMNCTEGSQGLATWLSVHTNNAPVLVLSTAAPHDDWCEHVNQNIKVYVPKRMQTGQFVVFTEAKSLPIKSCLRSLCTNAFNKNLFAGSTLDGAIYVWQFERGTGSSSSSIEVQEWITVSSPHGCAVAMDWATENLLITGHANGMISQWLVGSRNLTESAASNLLGKAVAETNEITAITCLSTNEFVVGTKDGSVLQCRSIGKPLNQYDITELRKHRFMVSTLLRSNVAGHISVISCDISGVVLHHDIRNVDDDTLTVQIPLPFKNAIACSRDSDVIYCPGNDGSLECYRIRDGRHTIIKGALRGKGNLIKCSDNGCWIITGLYGDEFQIFHIDN